MLRVYFWRNLRIFLSFAKSSQAEPSVLPLHDGQIIAWASSSLAALLFGFPLAGSSRSQGTGAVGSLAATVKRVRSRSRDLLAHTSVETSRCRSRKRAGMGPMKRALAIGFNLVLSTLCSVGSSGVAFAGPPARLLQLRQFPGVELVVGEFPRQSREQVLGRRTIFIPQVLNSQ